MTMMKLSRDGIGPVIVRPRWPYTYVYISSAAYEALCEAQSRLIHRNMSLILTRGLEHEGLFLASVHAVARRVGGAAFWLVFPRRRAEIADIFSSNGHTVSGDCVDVAIVQNGNRLKLLPFGVFTPLSIIQSVREKHRVTIEAVYATLRDSGFSLHSNATESMQIHCELSDALGKWRHSA